MINKKRNRWRESSMRFSFLWRWCSHFIGILRKMRNVLKF